MGRAPHRMTHESRPMDDNPMNLAGMVRTLQGLVAGTVVGLGLFLAGVRYAGDGPIKDDEGGGLVLAFFMAIGAGAGAGAIAGASVARRWDKGHRTPEAGG